MARHCPICRQIKRRKDTATCGAPDCIDAWKPLRASQRATFINMAEGIDLSPPTLQELPPKEISEDLKKILTPDNSLRDAKEMLSSIFGDKKGAN